MSAVTGEYLTKIVSNGIILYINACIRMQHPERIGENGDIQGLLIWPSGSKRSAAGRGAADMDYPGASSHEAVYRVPDRAERGV